ncbi:hypothetical protein DQX05_07830 [Paenibacillus thiaminolyticus]|uniref:Uncharacterized protein n=1 Tax=Paenibacillus thiaminolyticus TaxID=49283 RepID=A0A3A3H284_PANTH|nr:hypothetical protein DQX05_07830 [Paenibacillus thiaminolyticus]
MKGERRLGILQNYSIFSTWWVISGKFLHGYIIFLGSCPIQAITDKIGAFLQDSLVRIARSMKML